MVQFTVSVVMITYGQEKYIAEAIKGVFAQNTDFNIELIISNDASPDQADDVIKKEISNAPENITVQYTNHKKNLGMMSNFIWALEQAKGKYIALCEGDDYWTDLLKLQKQVDFLEENTDYIIHSGKAQILNYNKLREVIGNPRLKKSYSLPDFLTQNNLVTCTVLFKNQPIPKKKFKNLTFGDWMLYVQLLSSKEESLANVSDEVYSVYRVHEGGVMHTLSKKINNDIAHLKQIVAIRKVTKEKYSSLDIKTINTYCLDIFRYYFINKNFKKCIETFLQNFKLVNTKIKLRSYLGYIRYNYQKI